MSQLNSSLWFGTEESHFAALKAQEEVSKLVAAGPEAIKAAVLAAGGGRGEDTYGMPPIWEQHGSLAVVDISGSLVNGMAGFGRLFGVIGYGDIQQALSQIAASKDVTGVLLNIDSGGGQVDGVADTGDAIRALDASKPVISYTGGTMASAALWLGASARQVLAGSTAQVGSVGTMIVHMERSKQLDQMGVKATIVRFGDYKALSNPIEPLSDAGKKQLQSLADESGRIFVDYMAERRGMTFDKFQKTAGEGRMFMGQQAKDVGLIDGVVNLTGAVTQAKSLDKAGTHQQNRAQSRKGALNMKLSKKTVLAIAAGLALDKLGLAEPEANLEGVKLEGTALAAVEVEAKEVQVAIDTRIAAAVTEAKTPLEAKITTLTAAAETAKSEAKVASDKVALAEAAATQLKGQLDASAALAAQQAEIVKASMSVMSVALGGAAEVGAALTGTELLAEHKRLSEAFTKKFPTGGVAAVHTQIKQTKAVSVPPMLQHLVSQAAKTTNATAK